MTAKEIAITAWNALQPGDRIVRRTDWARGTALVVERDVVECRPGTTGTGTTDAGEETLWRLRTDLAANSAEYVDLIGRFYREDEVSNFVPDEPRALPTVEQIADKLAGKFGGHSDAYLDVAGEVRSFLSDAAPDAITPEEAAEAIYLNEYGRPWSEANSHDREVYGRAGAAVVARMRGESR